MPRLRTTNPPASCIYDKQRNESRPSFPFFHRRYPPLPLRKPQSHIRHLTPFISRVNFPDCGHTHHVNLIVSVSQGLLGLSEQWRKMLNKYITHPLYQIYQLCVRGAAFWNVVCVYGHCPKSFWPKPPQSNGHSGALFSDPIFSSDFWHCKNELKTRNCPFGYGKKVPQTIQASNYSPPSPS